MVDHSGHRARLKQALRENGLSGFAPHEVIELILYCALPRRDVNELAHRLDDEFGGISGLLKADREALISRGGLSENTAEIILAVGDCVRAYAEFDGEGDVFIRTMADAERFAASNPGKMLALLDSGRRVIFSSRLPDENADRYIYSHAVIYDASGVLVTGKTENETLRKRILELGMEFVNV